MEQIVVGVFDNQSEVARAKQALTDGGFAAGAMTVHASESPNAAAETSGDDRESGIVHFFRSLFGMDKHRDSAQVYGEAVRRGHCVLTVHADDTSQADRAQQIMEQCGAIDVDERSAAWSGERAGGASAAAAEAAAPAKKSRAKKSTGGRKTKIPVVEEELRVGKREVGRGGVRVFARMNEMPAEEKVQLREEHATVERRPVDRPATEADFAAFKEGAIEVRETAEEAVVDKRARVVEEVYVGKETTQREETVRDSVRHTDVQIDRLGEERASGERASLEGRDDFDDDDAAFRAHWQSHYSRAGGQYDEYAPAYGYGSSLGSSSRYAGRSWDDIEPDARRDWEARYPNSTWERFKDAVRHGWERLTGATGGQRIAADDTRRHPAP